MKEDLAWLMVVQLGHADVSEDSRLVFEPERMVLDNVGPVQQGIEQLRTHRHEKVGRCQMAG